MATFHCFEDIEAWQAARELTREICRVPKEGAFSRDFGLRNQIRKACISILSNIAEGFERDGKGGFSQFLSIAKGSAGEVRSHLYVALDPEYLPGEAFQELHARAVETSRMIQGLRRYLGSTAHRGPKFKAPNLKLET